MTAAPDELAIHLRRAEFNRALAEGDLAPIGPMLAPTALLVTGTDSGVIAGRKAQLLAWKREFAAPAPQRNRYQRRPETITLSSVEPIAMEFGTWTCLLGEVPSASGTYAAKWRKLADAWVIEAELFVTTG